MVRLDTRFRSSFRRSRRNEKHVVDQQTACLNPRRSVLLGSLSSSAWIGVHAGGSHGSPRSVHLCLQRGSWILCVGDRSIGFAPRAGAMPPLRASRLFPSFVSARAVSSVFARRGFAPPRAVPSLSTCVLQPYVCEIMSECFARRKQRSPWNCNCHSTASTFGATCSTLLCSDRGYQRSKKSALQI